MQQNHAAALDRIRASEGGLRVAQSEPGGASFCGVSLLAYREFCNTNDLTAPTLSDWQALAPGTDPLSVNQINAFYDGKVFLAVRFDELPSGVDYAIADWAVNSGNAGCLNALRSLYRTGPAMNFWRMDTALLAAIRIPPASLVVDAICNLRWAIMESAPDFTQPSAVKPGHIIGEGRAFRMSEVHRGAMEMLGFAPEAPRYTAPVLTVPQ